MIEQYFKNPKTWDRIRASWLFEPIERYVTWLHDQQYAAENIHSRVPILMHFAAYAQARGARSWPKLPDHVHPFVEQWLHDHGGGCSTGPGRHCAANVLRGPIEQMLRLVLPDFVGAVRQRHSFPFADRAPGFVDYLQRERGLARQSLRAYFFQLRRLEKYLKGIGLGRLADLSPAVLSAFLTEQGQEWGKSAMSGLCGSLRVFLRYAHRERLIARDLSSSVQAAKSYRLATIPRSIPWADVKRVLDSVDRRSALGKRDYAILLLLVTYGLRAREIRDLTLDHLDWPQERLRVPERKAGHSTAYPLSPIVGEAIVDYLKHGRPKTEDRHIFLRSMAPYRPCNDSCISDRTAHYLHKAGIVVPRRAGSHTLRHTCVQRLVDAHFSLKIIGDYIGHASPDTTAIYAKVDVESLRDLAVLAEDIP